MTDGRCEHCGKMLQPKELEYLTDNNLTECADCRYFHALGINTIRDYNLWLLDKWKIK